MTRRVLTLNAGSSSLKFGLFDADERPKPVALGQIDRIGGDARLTARGGDRRALAERSVDAPDQQAALDAVLAFLADGFGADGILAVGHRIVHGGGRFAAPARLDDDALAALAALNPFAPLHQPHNLAGVRAAREAFPRAVQVGCFDTAFHRGHPAVEDLYALPRDLLERGVRRYGFHGLSYEHLAGAVAAEAPELAEDGRVIVAHLGAGASMCGMRGGRSVASTMGFSALDGLPMGTRCGQIDPGVLLWLMQSEGMDGEAISDLLYKRSGLLGLSGVAADMRRLEASEAPEAAEAVAYFAHRARREIGSLAAAIGGIDALVFSAGIGEHSPRVRAEICEGLGWMGVAVDPQRNAADARHISPRDARVRVMVIPTDEERVIARAAVRFA